MSVAWKRFASSVKRECANAAAQTRAIVDGTKAVTDAVNLFHVIVDITDVKVAKFLFHLPSHKIFSSEESSLSFGQSVSIAFQNFLFFKSQKNLPEIDDIFQTKTIFVTD